MNVQEIVSEIQKTMSQDMQFATLLEVAKELNIDSSLPTNDAEATALQKEIVKAESHGVTGFDCGMVYIVLRDVQPSEFNDLDRLGTVSGYYSDYRGAGILEATLQDYPVRVQSTTIQLIILRAILNSSKALKPLTEFIGMTYD
mgnify:CR=1 FL=1